MSIIFFSLVIIKVRRMRFNSFFLLCLLILCGGACNDSPTPKPKKAVISIPVVSTNLPSISIHANSLQLKANEGLVYYQDTPFTGAAVSYYENGQEASRIDYVQGKKQGFYKKWFDTGLLSFESRYVEGKQDGLTSTWWANGNLRSESNYVAGVPDGVQKQWYKSGAKLKVIHLSQGKEEGLQQSWRENGKLYNNYEARNGRIFGLKRANLCYELDNERIK